MNIHESAEDYLEAILKLRESCGMVRSIDIVRELEYSKPSVSVAWRRPAQKKAHCRTSTVSNPREARCPISAAFNSIV